MERLSTSSRASGLDAKAGAGASTSMTEAVAMAARAVKMRVANWGEDVSG